MTVFGTQLLGAAHVAHGLCPTVGLQTSLTYSPPAARSPVALSSALADDVDSPSPPSGDISKPRVVTSITRDTGQGDGESEVNTPQTSDISSANVSYCGQGMQDMQSVSVRTDWRSGFHRLKISGAALAAIVTQSQRSNGTHIQRYP